MMLDGVRASRAGEAPAPAAVAGGLRRLARCVWLVLGSTAIYLAFNGLYVITLAFASNYGAGGATVLSYAYLFASYLVAGDRLRPRHVADRRHAPRRPRRLARGDRRHRAGRLPLRDAARRPGPGGADRRRRDPDRRGAAASFDAAQVDAAARLRGPALRLDGGRAAGQPAAAGAVRARPRQAGQRAGAGRRRPRTSRSPRSAGPSSAPTASSAPSSSSRLAFAAVLLVAGAGRGCGPIARELARDGLRFVALAAVCFGIGAAMADSLVCGLAAPLLAIGIGGILYGLTTSQLAPRQIRLLVGAVRPASAEA